MRGDIAQQFKIIQLTQPVTVVDQQRFPIREIDELTDLLFKAVDIVLDRRP